MELTKELKAQIDGMSYYELLKKWRFTPSGDDMFTGESGDYYSDKMRIERDANPAAATQASKDIGW